MWQNHFNEYGQNDVDDEVARIQHDATSWYIMRIIHYIYNSLDSLSIKPTNIIFIIFNI